MQAPRDPIPSSPSYRPSRVPGARPGPEGGRRQQNRLARTQALVDAAVRCFLTQGLDGATIDDVVRAAEVAKGSFYRYFQNKEDVVEAIFLPVTARVGGAMGTCAEAVELAMDPEALESAYRTMASDLLAVFLEAPEVVKLFLQERHGPPTACRQPILVLDAAVREHAVRMARAGRTHGLLRPLDPTLSALVTVGAVHELLWQTLHGRGPADPTGSTVELIDLVLHGVRAV